MAEETTGPSRESLAAQVRDLHGECDIDGYGDEGAGYDMGRFVDLLVSHGWTPPATTECACPRRLGSIVHQLDGGHDNA